MIAIIHTSSCALPLEVVGFSDFSKAWERIIRRSSGGGDSKKVQRW